MFCYTEVSGSFETVFLCKHGKMLFFHVTKELLLDQSAVWGVEFFSMVGFVLHAFFSLLLREQR